MEIVNLTPHTINIRVYDDWSLLFYADIEPSGVIARVSAKEFFMNNINGIPVTRTEYGEIENLPAPCEGTVYVVSSIVAARCPERADVFFPGRPVRDNQGQIVACAGLSHV